jgi:arylsulfatase A
MKLSIAPVFLLVTLSCQCAISFAADKPNIIVIYTDDQGFGDASCLNPQAKFKTPNLDRLAAEGISFTNAHCSDTVCTPSRYGLLTGR